jgi:hypothetical protein
MVNAKEMRTVFSCVTGGMVGNFPPTLLAPKIGGVPHEEVKKRWSGADFRWSGVFGVESNLVEQSAPKHALSPYKVQPSTDGN